MERGQQRTARGVRCCFQSGRWKILFSDRDCSLSAWALPKVANHLNPLLLYGVSHEMFPTFGAQ